VETLSFLKQNEFHCKNIGESAESKTGENHK
jgi:hypothetical protein